jgi:hypothetical protein
VPATNEYFGISVALNAAGDRLVVGAMYNSTNGTNTGKVYPYYLVNGVWTINAQGGFSSPVPTINEYFSYSVALNAAGDRLVVGAIGAGNTGKVYPYYLVGGVWTITSQGGFQSSTALSGEQFGQSVALNAAGDFLVVGAAANSIGGANTGKVYPYNLVGGVWTITSQGGFQSSTVLAGENFGVSLSLNAAGDRLVVGAVTNTSGAGKVYPYYLVNGVWTINAQGGFSSPVPATNEYFGQCVALNVAGDRLVVGAYGNSTDTGKVYPYSAFSTRYCNALASNTNIWVAGGGPTITSTLAYSLDGKTWTNNTTASVSYPFSGGICNALAWNGSKFVAGGSGTLPLAYSFNGITWYQSTFTGMTQCYGVTWNGSNWLACGQGTYTLATSPDGITWTGLPDQKFTGGKALAIAARNNQTNSLLNYTQSLTTGLRTDVTTLQSQVTLNLNNALGYNQLWYDVTSASPGPRIFQTGLNGLYTNTTGRPIMVSVTTGDRGYGDQLTINLFINGIQVSRVYILTAAPGFTTIGNSTVCGIVPVGQIYYCTATAGTVIERWLELR